jgi:hypothetical protein
MEPVLFLSRKFFLIKFSIIKYLLQANTKPTQSQHKANTKPTQSQHKANTKPTQSQYKAINKLI